MNEARRRNRLRHGLHTMQKAVAVLGSRALPSKRTALGRELREWQAALMDDLGGDPSTAQRQLIELAVRTKLMLDSIDAWLLAQESLVNKRRKTLIPVVRERQALADGLAKLLGQLGLERRARPVPSLAEYLGAKQTPGAEPPP